MTYSEEPVKTYMKESGIVMVVFILEVFIEGIEFRLNDSGFKLLI